MERGLIMFDKISNLPIPSNQEAIDIPEETGVEELCFSNTRVNAKGKVTVLNTHANLSDVTSFLGVQLRFNMLTFDVDISNEWGEPLATDFDDVRSRLISIASQTGLPKQAIDDHLVPLCRRNKFHPIKELLDGVNWDGVKRVDNVISCLNAKHPNFANTVMRHWLVGCVASVYEKPFNSKLVPVLQGDQSFRKTAFITRIANIADNAFKEGEELNPDNKDSVLRNIKSWIVELGELERTNKNSQGSLKAFITKSLDTVRPPYGRNDIQKPRQTSFIATVNGTDFLKDETGSSRFFVIEMLKPADVDKANKLLGWEYDGTGAIKQPKPELLLQFWAEVKQMYLSDHGWMLSDNTIKQAQTLNDEYQDKGAIYNYLRDVYVSSMTSIPLKLGEFTAGELAKDDEKLQGHHSSQIGKALKQLTKDGYATSRKARGNMTFYKFVEPKE